MSKQMRRIIILALLAILLLSPSSFSAPSIKLVAPRKIGTGKVHLSALAPNDERLPYLTILIEGDGLNRELKPKGIDSEYENGGLIELPEGFYRVTTRNSRYYPFRRAGFRVKAGTVTKINVYPVTRILAQALMVNHRGAHDEYAFSEPQSYESFSVGKAKSPLDLLIRFDEKKKRDGWIEYAGKVPKISGTIIEAEGEEREKEKPRMVMVSYDALAIYADKVRFNRNTLEIEAEGNVVIEDGKQRVRKQKVRVRFKGGVPEIDEN